MSIMLFGNCTVQQTTTADSKNVSIRFVGLTLTALQCSEPGRTRHVY